MSMETTVSLTDQFFFFDSDIDSKAKFYNNHHHSYFEICYLAYGVGNFLIEDGFYTVNAGDIVLIPSDLRHSTAYVSPTHSRLLLCVSEDHLPHYAHSLVEGNNYVYRNPMITADILSILKNIESEVLSRDAYSTDNIKGYVHMLLILLSRNQNYYKNEHTSGQIYVKKILNYIKERYHSEINLSQTAQEYGISPEHLSRIFKTETGLSFHEYLTDIRLKHAENMLKQKNKQSISEIAHSCGFSDSNYFSSKFKSVYGITPLQFHKRYSQKDNLN